MPSSSSSSGSDWPPTVMTVRLHRRRVGIGSLRAGQADVALPVWLIDRRLILRPHEAAIDQQATVAIDADEGAGAGDLGRIEDMRPVVEGGQRFLDLAEANIHLVRQLVGILILGFEPRLFGLKRVDRRLLVGRDVGRRALKLPKAVVMAVGEADGDLDPFPAFGARSSSASRLELLGDEAVEQAGRLAVSRRRRRRTGRGG